ncbi:MAG: hypothetical protein ACFE7E_07440 [Candidatus Hodarchaeota archaeon]
MKTEKSPKIAEEVLAEAEKTSNLETRQRILAKAVKAFVKAGRLDTAIRTLDKMKSPYWRSTTLATILPKLHESGEVEESRRIAERTLELSKEIEDVFSYVKTLVNVSEAFVKIDCKDRGSEVVGKALQVIEEKKNLGRLLGIIPNMVKVLADSGNIDKAQEEAEQIEDDYQQSIAFKYLVRALANQEKVSEAMKFADRIENQDDRSQAYMHIGLALLRAKRGDEARKVAKEIKNPYWRSHIIEWSKKVNRND